MKITPTMLKLTSLFENGTPELQYAYAEELGDGRGWTCGIAGFTDEDFGYFEDFFEPEANQGDDFGELWAAQCRNPDFIAHQHKMADEVYGAPAIREFKRLGFEHPLSLAVLYDTAIQHGDGDDPDSLTSMIEEVLRLRSAQVPEAEEEEWIAAFLETRREHLEEAHDPDTREVWAESVGRIDVFEQLVENEQWDLELPLNIDTDEYPEEVIA
jgi:chitosanase